MEGDPSGFAEEYPLEALEIATSDYMAKVRNDVIDYSEKKKI